MSLARGEVQRCVEVIQRVAAFAQETPEARLSSGPIEMVIRWLRIPTHRTLKRMLLTRCRRMIARTNLQLAQSFARDRLQQSIQHTLCPKARERCNRITVDTRHRNGIYCGSNHPQPAFLSTENRYL